MSFVVAVLRRHGINEQEILVTIQHFLQPGRGYQLIAAFHRLIGEFDGSFFRSYFLLELIEFENRFGALFSKSCVREILNGFTAG